jgi:hypothetical protein
MSFGAKIKAPALEILYFMNNYNHGQGVKIYLAHLPNIDRSLLEPGYLLSPNSSIVVDSYLPSVTLVDLLAKSPKVTHATLRFDDWERARVVLESLVGLGTDSRSVEDGNLCPRLSELRLDFGWEISDLPASKEWLLNRLKAGKESDSAVPLSIYASWKGEGTYVLLKGD